MAKEGTESSIVSDADRAAEILAKQGRESLRPSIDPSREAELDAAFAEAAGKPIPGAATADNFGRDNNGVPITIEGAPKPDKPADAPPSANAPAAGDPPAPPADKPADKPADPPPADKPADAPDDKPKGLLEDLLAKPDDQKPPEDPYENVKLRADASPKTRESFEEIKRIAKEREDKVRAEAETAKQSLQELQTKVAELEKRTVPDDVQSELKELRAFRAQFDTQNDPEFKQKFDARIDHNYDAVYAKLRQHGLAEDQITLLKGYDRATRDTTIERFLSKLPSLDRKFIEAKLLDNVNVGDDREKALEEARAKADEILAKRKQEPAAQVASRDSKVAEILRPVLPKLPWIHLREVPPTAGAEDKKRIEADNKFALAMQEALKTAIVDDSPAVRAEAAIAVPLAQYYLRGYTAEKARADALQKQLDEIKSAGALSRTGRSVGNAAPAPAPAPRPDTPPASTGDALDELFAQVTRR